MRRFLLILSIVVVLLGVAGAVWFFFLRTPSTLTVTPGGSTTLPAAGATTTPSIDPEPTTPTDPTSPGDPVAVTARLVKITDGPVVSGMVVIDTRPATASTSLATEARYIDRQSGNVYSYSKESNIRTRISNKTIPGIQSASWLPDGSLAFVRYLTGDNFSTINTYALSATGAAGFFLSQDLADIAISSTSVLTLASGVSGSVASVVRTDGTASVPVFTTPLSALRASFAGVGQYLATTKPSAALLGSTYLVDKAGRFSRVAGPLPGLVAKASPTGKWVLVSFIENTFMRLTLVNTVSGEAISLPLATIVDKCAWAADESAVICGVPVNPPQGASYPDDWYQGAVSFADRIWKVNIAGRFAELVLDFTKETETALDLQSLALNPANSLLVFQNKRDGSLWGFSL